MDRFRLSRPGSTLGLWIGTIAILSSALHAQSGSSSKEAAWLGVYLRNVERQDIQALDLDADTQGVVVSGIDDDGPAANAGIEPGDVVTQLDGEPVQNRDDFVQRLSAHSPGDRVKLVTVRDGKQRTVSVVLGSRPAEFDSADPGQDAPAPDDVFLRRLGVGGPTLGVRTLDLEAPELAAYFGVEANAGVLVTGLVEGGGAAEAGLQPGDVIMAIEAQPVRSTDEIRAALRKHDSGDRVTVRFRRRNAEQSLAVELGEGVELSGLTVPLPDRTWRFGNDLGDLRRELEDLKREVRRLERDLGRQR